MNFTNVSELIKFCGMSTSETKVGSDCWFASFWFCFRRKISLFISSRSLDLLLTFVCGEIFLLVESGSRWMSCQSSSSSNFWEVKVGFKMEDSSLCALVKFFGETANEDNDLLTSSSSIFGRKGPKIHFYVNFLNSVYLWWWY